MKKTILLLATLLCFTTLFSQEEIGKKGAPIPSVDIKTLDGKLFNTSDIQNDGKPIIISLWSTTCKPCIAELLAIADVYEDWVEETGVKLYAISTDDSKTAARVAPFVNGKNWDYEVLLDINWDFKRAMNVVDIPFLCILNGNREVVWLHTSYAPGSEEEVYQELLKLIKK